MNIDNSQIDMNVLAQLLENLRKEDELYNSFEKNLIEHREKLEDADENGLGIRIERIAPQIIFTSESFLIPQERPILLNDVVLQWETHGKIFEIIKKNGLLEFVLKAENGNIENSGLLPIDSDKNIDQAIHDYAKYDAFLNEKGLIFTKPFYKKYNEDFDITLINNTENVLTWHLFNKTTKLSHCTPFEFCTYPSNRCHSESSYAVRSLRHTPDLSDFEVYGITFNEASLEKNPYNWPFTVFMEPKSFPSRIDGRFYFSKYMWAVTLVSNGGFFGCHAQLIIEGVNDGFIEGEKGSPFIWMADYNPKINSEIILPEELVYQERTKIWMRSSSKIKEMLRNIKAEIERPRTRNFDIRGASAIYTDGDNCFSWIIEKFKLIDITINLGPEKKLASIVRLYTNKDSKHQQKKPTIWL